jgi:hypothetical protein
MTHLLGDTYRTRWTILDSESNPVTGMTFTIDQTMTPSGGAFTPTIIEIGTLGTYEISWTLAEAGTYYARAWCDNVPGVAFSVYEFEFATDHWEAHDLITHYFTVLDDDGRYFGAAPVTVEASFDPQGLQFAVQITNFLNGLYRLTWTPSREGAYSVRLIADRTLVGDEPSRFFFEDLVVAELEPSPLEPVVGDTLDDLVRATALLCGDLLDTTSSEDAPTADTWIDDLTLSAVSPKSLKGANLYIFAAIGDANVGVEARVVDSTDHGLTLAHAIPVPARQGDRGYLVNLESKGFPRQRYVNCINDRIRDSFPLFLLPARWTFGVDDDTVFSSDTPYLTVPPHFTHLYSVDYPTQGYSPYETDIPMGSDVVSGWWWDDAEERIVIGGNYRHLANGQPIRLRGYQRHPILESASAQCAVDRKWVTEMSAGTLIVSLRDARRLPEGQNHINRADAWMSAMSTNVMPGTVRIR